LCAHWVPATAAVYGGAYMLGLKIGKTLSNWGSASWLGILVLGPGVSTCVQLAVLMWSGSIIVCTLAQDERPADLHRALHHCTA
jgi:hypothetical protein